MSIHTIESSDHVEAIHVDVEARPEGHTRAQRFATWVRGTSRAERWVLTGSELAIAWFFGLILLATHLSLQSFLYR